MRKTTERYRRAATAVAIVLLAAPAMGARRAEGKPPEDQPLRPGLVEETGVELTLVDVEVTDEKGRPIHGLEIDDFAVTLNWKAWPVYSADNLCDCEDLPSAAVDAELPGAPPRSEPSPTPRPSENPVRFVLYLDFSQLQTDGRARAIAEAKRWLHESLRPGDEASIVSYGTDTGLKERCSFTSDRQKLAEAVDAAQNDPKQIEAWPAFLWSRIEECQRYPTVCPSHAVGEYFHSRRALEALREFLEALGETPGRKAVLYFNQNGVLRPGRFYGQGETKGGDHTGLLEDVSSIATASRASVYPVFVGDELDLGASFLTAAAVNFGANLADGTGGRYNGGLIDLRRLLDTTARAGCCIYRIGLRPPSGTARGVYQVRVEAGGRRVPWQFRVRFENEMDRWLRRARAVLRNPSGAQDLPVAAALVPVRSTGGRWRLAVQVALEVNALAYLPADEGRSAQWQVGALLRREGNDETWEMLGVSSIRRKGTAGPAAAIVHRRDIDELRPGAYRLAAFVRDENTGLFGGAEASIELPPPGSDRIAGPVVLRSPRKFFLAALPALAGKARKSTSVSEVRDDALPKRTAPLETPDTLEIETWLCPGVANGGAPAPVRFVSRNGAPLFQFEPAEPRPAGGCLMYSDSIDAAHLAAGSYSYRFRWSAPGRAEPLEAEANFEIATAPSPPELTLP